MEPAGKLRDMVDFFSMTTSAVFPSAPVELRSAAVTSAADLPSVAVAVRATPSDAVKAKGGNGGADGGGDGGGGDGGGVGGGIGGGVGGVDGGGKGRGLGGGGGGDSAG